MKSLEYKGQINIYPYKGDVTNIEIYRYGRGDYELVDLDTNVSKRGDLLDIFNCIDEY